MQGTWRRLRTPPRSVQSWQPERPGDGPVKPKPRRCGEDRLTGQGAKKSQVQGDALWNSSVFQGTSSSQSSARPRDRTADSDSHRGTATEPGRANVSSEDLRPNALAEIRPGGRRQGARVALSPAKVGFTSILTPEHKCHTKNQKHRSKNTYQDHAMTTLHYLGISIGHPLDGRRSRYRLSA